jgi:hypothetical protein
VTRSLKGMEDFLGNYVGTADRPVPFGGRQHELAKLDGWLSDVQRPYALIVADAGSGKSALLAHWALDVAASQRADVAFAPVSIRFDTNLRQHVLGMLLERLQFILGTEISSESPDVWQAELLRLFREERDPERPLLIVLDGADEAAAWRPERELPFPAYPVAGLKVVVSARRLFDRDARGWLRALNWEDRAEMIEELVPLDAQAIADILGAVRADGGEIAALSDQVARLTDGDPLLVSLYAEAIGEAGFIAPERLTELADGGLEDLFGEWWRFQKETWRSEGRDALRESEETERVLAALSAALGPPGSASDPRGRITERLRRIVGDLERAEA